MELCACGGYPVAICTQCRSPLCNQHAYKWYAKSLTDEYKRLETLLNKFPNPVVRGKTFDIAGLVSQHLINSYEDRHVCLGCHQQNVQRDASALLQGLTIPEDEVDFMMWLLFDTPFRKLISLSDHSYIPHLSDKEMIQFWLRFARQADVPLATSSPVWVVGPYRIDTEGKACNAYNGMAEIAITPGHSTYAMQSWIANTVDSLLRDLPETTEFKEERKGDETIGEYTAELLRQWQQQDAARQQHYQSLTASLQQTARDMAEAMRRTGTRQDAALGGLFSKTVGWFVWIDSRIVNDQPGEYFGTTYRLAEALIISNQGILYTATGTSGRLKTDPRAVVNRSKQLAEVTVNSDDEFTDVRQKLADFAAKHNLQI